MIARDWFCRASGINRWLWWAAHETLAVVVAVDWRARCHQQQQQVFKEEASCSQMKHRTQTLDRACFEEPPGQTERAPLIVWRRRRLTSKSTTNQRSNSNLKRAELGLVSLLVAGHCCESLRDWSSPQPVALCLITWWCRLLVKHKFGAAAANDDDADDKLAFMHSNKWLPLGGVLFAQPEQTIESCRNCLHSIFYWRPKVCFTCFKCWILSNDGEMRRPRWKWQSKLREAK